METWLRCLKTCCHGAAGLAFPWIIPELRLEAKCWSSGGESKFNLCISLCLGFLGAPTPSDPSQSHRRSIGITRGIPAEHGQGFLHGPLCCPHHRKQLTRSLGTIASFVLGTQGSPRGKFTHALAVGASRLFLAFEEGPSPQLGSQPWRPQRGASESQSAGWTRPGLLTGGATDCGEGGLGSLAMTPRRLPAQFIGAILRCRAKPFSYFCVKTLAGRHAFHWEGFQGL